MSLGLDITILLLQIIILIVLALILFFFNKEKKQLASLFSNVVNALIGNNTAFIPANRNPPASDQM